MLPPATSTKFSLLPLENTTGSLTRIVRRVPVIYRFTVPDDIKDKKYQECLI